MIKLPEAEKREKIPTMNKSEAFKLFRQFMAEIQRDNDKVAISTGEVRLTPKTSSISTAEGTVFYCSTDNSIYVGVE